MDAADGYVRSEAAGAVLLKPLSAAVRDHDHIRAVIRNTAVNHNGSTIGPSAPSTAQQIELLKECYAGAGIDPLSISYLESHGTGTFLGDDVEWQALSHVFAGGAPGSCALGAVKSLMGHSEYASGMVGLISAIIAIEDARYPASFNTQNGEFRFDLGASPFFLADKSREWKHSGAARRAGVSAFGFGGANAHVLLEEAPVPPIRSDGGGPGVLCLSHRTPQLLRESCRQFSNYLQKHESIEFRDVCYTANRSVSSWPYRLAIVAESATSLVEQLTKFADDGVVSSPSQYSLSNSMSEVVEAPPLAQGTSRKLADSFVMNLPIDWDRVMGVNRAIRIEDNSISTSITGEWMGDW